MPRPGPTRAGFAVCDVLSGMTAAFAVSSRAVPAHPHRPGPVASTSRCWRRAWRSCPPRWRTSPSPAIGRQQFGNQAISRKVTANLFRAKDSYLLLAVNDEKQYRALMTALGRADVLDDPRFADWFLRKENEAALRAIIEAALASEGCARPGRRGSNAAGAPCASIWRIEEMIDHPQIVARGVMQTAETPYGPLRLMGSGFQLAHGGGRLDSAPPALGAHTDAVLAEIGYAETEIAALRADAVV